MSSKTSNGPRYKSHYSLKQRKELMLLVLEMQGLITPATENLKSDLYLQFYLDSEKQM